MRNRARGILRSGQACADAVTVNWNTGSGKRLEFHFVKAAAGDDSNVVQTALVQNQADPPSMVGKIPAVDANAAELDSQFLQAGRQSDQLLRCRLRVICIDQQNRALRPRHGKINECVFFPVVNLDK